LRASGQEWPHVLLADSGTPWRGPPFAVVAARNGTRPPVTTPMCYWATLAFARRATSHGRDCSNVAIPVTMAARTKLSTGSAPSSRRLRSLYRACFAAAYPGSLTGAMAVRLPRVAALVTDHSVTASGILPLGGSRLKDTNYK
jgi:hypothetical protein